MSAQEKIIERVPFMSDKDAELILAFIERIGLSKNEVPNETYDDTPDFSPEKKRAAFERLEKLMASIPPSDYDPEKRKAFLELDEMINNMNPFPADFDYDKERAKALEEKYGRFD